MEQTIRMDRRGIPPPTALPQRPGLILATAEEWGIFCGALPVLGRLALLRLREGWGCGTGWQGCYGLAG